MEFDEMPIFKILNLKLFFFFLKRYTKFIKKSKHANRNILANVLSTYHEYVQKCLRFPVFWKEIISLIRYNFS